MPSFITNTSWKQGRALTDLFLGVWLQGRGLDVGLGLLLLLLLLQALGVHRDPTVAVQLLSLWRHHLVVCSRAVASRLLVLFAAVPPVEYHGWINVL